MQELDLRIVIIAIEVNGRIKNYQDIQLSASGTKFANANQNEAEVKLTNIDKQTADYILTETSPFNLNKTPKTLTVFAGRQSYGVSKIFTGNIISSVISQPPDITITLKCLDKNFQKGQIIAKTLPGRAQLSQIAQQAATDLNVALDFQATDKSIANYSYSGSATKQVDKLGELGAIDAFVDNDILIVKNSNKALNNRVRILNMENGLVGIPEMTEEGIKVKFLIDNVTTLGGLLRLESVMYPGANGDYIIYKLGFEITNRAEPFWYIAEAKRL